MAPAYGRPMRLEFNDGYGYSQQQHMAMARGGGEDHRDERQRRESHADKSCLERCRVVSRRIKLTYELLFSSFASPLCLSHR